MRKYRAKTKDTGRIIEGYYAEYPETTYCFTSDYENHPVRTIHVLMVNEMTDWGLPNRLVEYEIDPKTLEPVDIIAEKVWTRNDIKDALTVRGFTPTDENVNKVCETGYIAYLEEATERDFDIIDEAIYCCQDLEEKC